ncbi:MAG: hypothetical protein AVDCRST_MAG64-3531 [uncultured Phycisphaerae bacterium]|uniref:Lipoprotein n=1 Tax=uncultured Phycisphaerae bacterium TaxID=904963 RepID=A0A6J4Q2Y0_9BACT|nr:MAG: hypothetical protein AVDCRST_MAG64-3531 [uncultured Phycisphaerae bacterium]
MKTMRVRTLTLVALLACGALPGCSTSAPGPRATDADPALATAAHWLAQPATETVTHDDYDALWDACREAARWRGFRVDRADYRGGLMLTHPLTSKQFFEVWRRDVATLPDVAESSLATMRRVVRFEIKKGEDGTYACVPKALVERYAQTERRITSVTQYRESFSTEEGMFGSRERDRGVEVPVTYWYATGRDEVLERALAEGVRSRLRGRVASR